VRHGSAPDAAVFEALAHAAFARIPEPFARHLAGVRVTVSGWRTPGS
jgi:predicted Zn-dependent protease with MMP-like domain